MSTAKSKEAVEAAEKLHEEVFVNLPSGWTGDNVINHMAKAFQAAIDKQTETKWPNIGKEPSRSARSREWLAVIVRKRLETLADDFPPGWRQVLLCEARAVYKLIADLK